MCVEADSSILAWEIPWTEEPGRLQSIGLLRVRHNWSNLAHTHTHLIYPFICQWTFRLLSCLSYLVNSAEMTVGVSSHILNAPTSDLGPAVRLISLTCPACHHQPCLLSFFSCHLSFLECLISLLMPFSTFPVKFPDQDAFPAWSLLDRGFLTILFSFYLLVCFSGGLNYTASFYLLS